MWHLLPDTGHHGPGTAGGCPLQAPATESGALGLLAAAGLGPIIADALLQSLRSSPGSSPDSGLGVMLGARPGGDQASMNYLLNTASLS